MSDVDCSADEHRRRLWRSNSHRKSLAPTHAHQDCPSTRVSHGTEGELISIHGFIKPWLQWLSFAGALLENSENKHLLLVVQLGAVISVDAGTRNCDCRMVWEQYGLTTQIIYKIVYGVGNLVCKPLAQTRNCSQLSPEKVAMPFQGSNKLSRGSKQSKVHEVLHLTPAPSKRIG